MDPRYCKHCAVELPSPHDGRGKQKTFCSDTCRVKFAYRERLPNKVTNAERRGATPKFRLRLPKKTWLAALWDGEGYIGLAKRQKGENRRWYYFPIVQVYNTNAALVEEVEKTLGAIAKIEHRVNGAVEYKKIYRVSVSRSAMAKFLTMLLPHLYAKRRQAEIIIEFCKVSDRCYVREYPEAVYETMWQEMATLNRKGAN